MSKDWGYTESEATFKQWRRSWRQELFTPLGSDFELIGHMQRVTIVDGLPPVFEPLQPVRRKASEVILDPRVQQLAALMTELLDEWYLEDRAILESKIAEDLAPTPNESPESKVVEGS